jgi:hypothetical protein
MKMQTSSNNIVSDNSSTQTDPRQLLSVVEATLEAFASADELAPQSAEMQPDTTTQARPELHEVADKLATGERELRGLLKQLRRVLPATYFRTNSRIYRVTEQINKQVGANEEHAFALLDSLRQHKGYRRRFEAVIESLQRLRSQLRQSLS